MHAAHLDSSVAVPAVGRGSVTAAAEQGGEAVSHGGAGLGGTRVPHLAAPVLLAPVDAGLAPIPRTAAAAAAQPSNSYQPVQYFPVMNIVYRPIDIVVGCAWVKEPPPSLPPRSRSSPPRT